MKSSKLGVKRSPENLAFSPSRSYHPLGCEVRISAQGGVVACNRADARAAVAPMSGRGAQPLPGGYKVAEKVFFTGVSKTFPSGNTLVHGQQGEVTGPAISETHKGKGVAVRFPGNKGDVSCHLNNVCRLRCRPSPAPHTRDASHTPCVPRGRCSPLPGCGRDGGWGRGSGWSLRVQRQRGRRPSPTA